MPGSPIETNPKSDDPSGPFLDSLPLAAILVWCVAFRVSIKKNERVEVIPKRGIGSLQIMLLMALLFASCRRHESAWVPGGIYSISNGDGSFGVVKVLAIDPGAVSIRIYQESFPERPDQIDPAALSLGSAESEDGMGIGHLPLSPRDFALWFPVLILKADVAENELEGYRFWKASGGGVFEGSEEEEPVTIGTSDGEGDVDED